MRILYDSKSPVFKKPFGTLREGEKCELGIHIPKQCAAKEVIVEFFKEEQKVFEFPLLKFGEIDESYERWSGSFELSAPDLYFYRFFIKTEKGEFPLFKEGYNATNMWQGALWQQSCVPCDFSVPKFFAGRVMYQIFPDRFNKKGECSTKGKLEPFYLHQNTSDIPDFLPDSQGEVKNCDFFGGNLNGIADKLYYLKSLGVSVIYLNPIFKAYSNHRYDTADYKKIDELLGTEEDFKRLCKKAHALNMKIILDGVFSHTGSNSVYFDQENIFKNGAVSSESSPYRQWYDFQSYPDTYTSWWGIKTLPCVNELNESYMDFIFGGEDSVIAHWLNAGADGFRLDVADELPDEFIKKLRARLKEIKPSALLIGEVWEDASNKVSYGVRRRYFTGGELDSVMNYPFRNAVLDFVLGKDGGDGLAGCVMTICENYPREVVNTLMNMLSTHDTARALSTLSGVTPPADKADRASFRLNEKELSLAEKRLKCAAFLQFVLPGMPCIYYGDEIGTQGFEDPFCRTFFDWEKQKTSQLKVYFKSLAAVRNKSKALKEGDTYIQKISDGLVKITRKIKNQSFVAYVNCSSEEKLVDESLKTLFSEEFLKEKGILKPNGVVLFKK